MKSVLAAFAVLAAASATGCSSYHPASLSASPWGPGSAAARATHDRSLDERYGGGQAAAEMRFPEGAHAPAPRPAGQDWGVDARPKGVWSVTPLEREAERRSIARDMPHASVKPWGTARGH